MNKKITKNNWLKTILMAGLVVTFLFLTTLNALAQGEQEGEDPVVQRQNQDEQQTQTEAEELARLQKEDEKTCKEEVDGSLGGTGGGTQTRPEDYNQYNPNGDRDGDSIPNSQDND